jgi:hypothetical protein
MTSAYPPWSNIVDAGALSDEEFEARTSAAKLCDTIGSHYTPTPAVGHEQSGCGRGIGQCLRCGWQTYVTGEPWA